MSIIVTAKGLRYTITLLDNEVKIVENADIKSQIRNAMILNKEKKVLLNVTYKLKDIKAVKFANLTQDTSLLTIELINGNNKDLEMTPKDLKDSNALKTHVKQIADYMQENLA